MPAHPHPEDHPHEDLGHVLTRRQALGLFTTPFLLAFAGCHGRAEVPDDAPLSGSCVVRPELTEGPFYLDADLLRSDIREDRAGVPLALTFTVSRVVDGACEVLPGALVDVWHADASGDYSGVGPARGATYLRGSQQTGADGAATFLTVYPGWYPGRAPHVHFKVRSSTSAQRAYEFTSQLFFDDALSEEVYTSATPYRERGAHDRPNARDGIYRRGGSQMLLALTERTAGGYQAAFDVALYVD
jgi:protocatechuate 3,4-dioxygenase beta subunit